MTDIQEIQKSYLNFKAECESLNPNVRLLAVSKYQPTWKIEVLYKLGQRDFGENYLQELESKAKSLAHLEGIRWHYIGSIQSNKIKKIVAYSSVILALDNFEHARLIHEAQQKNCKSVEIFCAANLGGEKSKSGVVFEQLEDFVLKLQTELPNLKIAGLMSIPPKEVSQATQNKPQADPTYNKLVQKALELGLTRISLGMSGDWKTAVASGATDIRIGTQIFGERPVLA